MSLANASPFALALLGLILGIRHATDADHVIAITAILARERGIGSACRIGLVWGLGHMLTVLIVGSAIIIFRMRVPARLGLSMEFVVSIVLIVLGIAAAARVLGAAGRKLHLVAPRRTDAQTVHVHPHSHSILGHRYAHTHPHAHPVDHGPPTAASAPHHHHLGPDPTLGFPPGRSLVKSFGVGLVHGLAGSAAIALIVLAAIPKPAWAVAYLVIFCLGVLIGMVLITTAISLPFAFLSRRMPQLHRNLAIGAGLLSLGFGLLLAYQIGLGDQLFGAAPRWIPR